MKHRKLVPHCRWRNTIAVTVAALTAGTWIPFVTTQDDGSDVSDDTDEFTVPPPLHEGHAPLKWDVPVSLKKPPKNPATDPAHTQPTPKVTVHPTPKPEPRPVVHPVPPPVPVTSVGTLVAFLALQVGDRYLLGGNGPFAWDCSGLTKAAYAKIGVHLPRTSQAQSLAGRPVSLSALQTGDLLFWGVPGLAYHVAVYVGNGQYIAAENPATGVVRQSLSYYRPDFARRIL